LKKKAGRTKLVKYRTEKRLMIKFWSVDVEAMENQCKRLAAIYKHESNG